MRGIAQPAAAFVSVAVLLVLAGAGSRAATSAVPPQFSDTLVASVQNPTAMTFTPDGRILVTGQFGELSVIANDSLLPTPALDLSGSLCTADEQGLLGVERDPSFASNGFIYVYYTHARGSVCENRVSRFTMTGNVASPSSELVLIDGIPSLGNHNAGDLHFGPDGYLYVSVGDAECDYLGDSGCGGDERRLARPERAARKDPPHHARPAASRPATRSRARTRARCNTTGRTTRGQHVPGDLRARAAEPVPVHVRPQRSWRHAVLHQRRRPERLGGGRPRHLGRRLRLERPRGDVRQRAADELRRAAGRDDEPDLLVQARRLRRGDHRRRRSSRTESGPPRSTARTCSATTSAGRSSC